MHTVENESFPRGGKKIFNAGVKRKQEDNLFEIETKPPKKSKKKIAKNKSGSEDLWQASLKIQGTLTYNKIQEGMTVLSCVRHISNIALQIEFPGLTFGVVTVNNISDSFTKLLSERIKLNHEEPSDVVLKNVIKVGQLMPAKILSVTNTEKGYDIQASVNPRDINGDKKHNNFKKGETIWANIVSELDHGYELSVGVNNCRIFLPHKNIDGMKKYHIGEPLYCVIHKVESSAFVTTLTVNAKQEYLEKSKADDIKLNDVIPGFQVEFIIEEILPHGFKGEILENCLGYIDETQMFSKFNKAKLKEGACVTTHVLFVEPITKVTYLTLHGLGDLPEPSIEIGKVTSAKVLSNVSRGLYLNLGKNDVGFITNKRLLKTLPIEAQTNVIDSVRKKYTVGSSHDCRILDYNYMQQLYICTFEKQLIKEKIFSARDLNLGQIVPVKVVKVTPNGLVVKAGHVQGFVPNIHLSNVKYTENIKSKFMEGANVNARVLNVTPEENVIFTLKSGLVESETCLTKMEDAVPNSHHVGFVVQTKISGALIAFYGGAKGWISNKVLNSDNSEGYLDPREYFFIGQVVSVWVLEIRENKLQLSLSLPRTEAKPLLKKWQVVKGKITVLRSDRIDVEVIRQKQKVPATVPMAQLSVNPVLCPLFLKTLRPGHELTNLMCLNNTSGVAVMSRREAYKKESRKIPKFRDLKKNMMLRCLFEEASDSGIYVSTPLKDFHEKIFVAKENIFYDEATVAGFEKQQCVLSKVLSVGYNERKLDLAVGFRGSPHENTKSSLTFLVDTIEDLHYITRLYAEKKPKLFEYSTGARVQCRVQEINIDGSCFVKLPNGINGMVPAHLRSPNCVVGSTVEGVVIDYNISDEELIICLKNNLKQKINKIQDGIFKKSFLSSCAAKVLYITKFYVLGLLTDTRCNRQMVYLPLVSDTIHPGFSYKEEMKLKVIVYRRIEGKIIGLPKKIYNKEHKIDGKEQTSVPREKVTVVESDTVTSDEETMETDAEECEPKIDIDSTEEEILDNGVHEIANGENVSFSENNTESVLSGANSFYLANDGHGLSDTSSSDEDEKEEQQTKKKKKKNTPAERAEMAKKEEERIVRIEKELADSTATPQSAEQFDRLLLSNPNSSELWLKYMAMHVAAAELDRARAVGRKATEVINMTLVEEKFNVWIALLNLENMYGTKESFENLFEEAVKYNDSLETYLSVIKMLATSGKLLEMEEKIKKLKSKEKQSTKMWLEIGQVYYTLQKFKEARNVKEAALKSILDKKRQFDLIIRFGIMEFQLGDLEQAVANFETILNAYPAKVNIWTIYVDQLVKRKKISLARKVLERAVGQKFALKTMKILFRKFIDFETQHGSPEAVEQVKSQAKDYVKTLGIKSN